MQKFAVPCRESEHSANRYGRARADQFKASAVFACTSDYNLKKFNRFVPCISFLLRSTIPTNHFGFRFAFESSGYFRTFSYRSLTKVQ